MTLFKQMAIAVSIIIITLLTSIMIVNYQSSKNDMLANLYETTVNNISTLSSKIASQGDEPASIMTTIDSEFDSGYYKMIDFKSNDGKSNYKQIDNDPVEGVPLWFIEFTNIKLENVTSDVSSGWNILGTVTVIGDEGIIYKGLYKMFVNLSYLFAVSVTLSLIILYIMLHFILKPLYKVQNQAEAILKNEFVIQNRIPFTTEFKDVVYGMNAMVKKVEEIFKKGNESAQRNKELLYNDPVTKLFNRRYLMLKLPDMIKLENKTNGGSVIFVALSGAEVLNQILGRRKADDLFENLATSFKNITKKFEQKVIARVNGTEFTIVLSDCEADIASDIARRINRIYKKLLKENELDPLKIYIDMGIYRYKPTVSNADLLTRADNALSIAKAKEDDNTHLYEEKDDENAMGKEQWRTIIEDSINNSHFSLRFWPTMNVKTKQINHKVMTFTIDAGENKQYFYGDFIAPAINLGLVSKMYIITLKNLLIKEHKELDKTICSIRISNEFIKDEKSYDELSKLFEKYATKLNFQLSFEVSDIFAIHNTTLVKRYVDLFAKYNFGFGLNTFTGESNDFTYLKVLNPQFLKSDCSFLLDQSKDSMAAIQVITDSLGIEIIATFVQNQEELDRLLSKEIDFIQGPMTDII